ncbi:hypothetical protein RRG08_053576 [Elysia crispata]|uniref:Uncharacterized protein n=1 Tax=Elysia crispata TaxID=231223 RepID=A0AAE1CR11_9GAST|nr:hypothetical protein RRG08_053576 [Elysia crispata]
MKPFRSRIHTLYQSPASRTVWDGPEIDQYEPVHHRRRETVCSQVSLMYCVEWSERKPADTISHNYYFSLLARLPEISAVHRVGKTSCFSYALWQRDYT